jgi:hypothetical protein
MLWVETVVGAGNADPLFSSLGSALLDPNLFKVALQKVIAEFNRQELMKQMDDPSYQPQEISNTEVDKNPWEALKKLKEIKTKQQTCPNK